MVFSNNNIPAPNSVDEFEKLLNVAKNVSSFPHMVKSEQDDFLLFLEKYECYYQLIVLLEWRINNKIFGDIQLFSDYLYLMKIQYFGFERNDLFIKTAKKCIENLKINFSIFRVDIIEPILGLYNYHAHVKLFSAVIDSFIDIKQKVLLMERLALIYEKKLFLETDVVSAYKQLLEIEPTNLKALKFFKFYYIQLGQWQDVITQLERMLSVVCNPFEKQRIAHELAQIYLYNLNKPLLCKEILQEYCLESQLDIKQTLSEALERTNSYDELINLLIIMESNEKNNEKKAEYCLKISLTYYKIKLFKSSVDYANKSLLLNKHNLQAIETGILALIELKDNEGILNFLNIAIKEIENDSSKSLLLPLKNRVLNLVNLKK